MQLGGEQFKQAADPPLWQSSILGSQLILVCGGRWRFKPTWASCHWAKGRALEPCFSKRNKPFLSKLNRMNSTCFRTWREACVQEKRHAEVTALYTVMQEKIPLLLLPFGHLHMGAYLGLQKHSFIYWILDATHPSSLELKATFNFLLLCLMTNLWGWFGWGHPVSIMTKTVWSTLSLSNHA